jgi:hypothetical protein
MRNNFAMIRIIAATLLTLAALGIAQDALAAGACRPTRDGKDRIERAGGCPSGYFVRGACCESFQAMSQPAAPATGIKTCPPGMVSKLGYCVVAP